MSIVSKVSSRAVAMKPPHGSECNRCGVCCEAKLCSLAQEVFYPIAAGPCPALTGLRAGERACGLVADPGHWSPVRTAIHGREAMSAAARFVIGTGDGCDARINGEPVDVRFKLYLFFKYEIDLVPELRAAHAMWRTRR